MSKNRDTISPERWAYLKQVKVPEPRLVFVSQCYRQVEHTSAAGVVDEVRFAGPVRTVVVRLADTGAALSVLVVADPPAAGTPVSVRRR